MSAHDPHRAQDAMFGGPSGWDEARRISAERDTLRAEVASLKALNAALANALERLIHAATVASEADEVLPFSFIDDARVALKTRGERQ